MRFKEIYNMNIMWNFSTKYSTSLVQFNTNLQVAKIAMNNGNINNDAVKINQNILEKL